MPSLAPSGPRSPSPAATAAVVAAVCLAAYANALPAGFVFDDRWAIEENPAVRSLSNYLPGGGGGPQNPGRAVGELTFALNHALGGLDPFGFHALNVLVHLANALLLAALARTIFRTPRLQGSALAPLSGTIAFVAALLFVAHPIQTQAVTYVVQRFASLATTFYLAALLGWARWRLDGRSGRGSRPARAATYLAALAAAALAMRTKEIAVTLPAALLLFEAAFFGRPGRRTLLALVPFALVAAFLPFQLLGLGRPLGEVLADASERTRMQTALSRGDYLVTQISVVAGYLRLLLLPAGQSADPDHPVYRTILAPRVLASLAVLLAVWGGAAWLAAGALRRRGPRLDPAALVVAFGVAWFFLALSVESSVIPIVDVMFEHRVYLPSVGFFLAAATGIAWAASRGRPERAARLAAGVGLGLALALAVATHLRNRVWRDELALWSDTVARSPGKARAHYNLGEALVRAGRLPEAIERFRTAIRTDPRHVLAYNNLGAALSDTGRREEAVEVLRAAIRVKPDHPEAYYNLGRILLLEGRPAEAVPLFERAIALRPDYAEAHANLGAALNQAGRPAEAARRIEEAGALVAGLPEAQFNLGVAYVLLGDPAGAERQARILAARDPGMAARLREFAGRRGVSPRGD